MNNTLSLPRLGRVMRKHWIENFSFYGMAALALFGLMALVFTLLFFADGGNYSEDSFYVVYLIGLFLMGTIFASISFSMLGDKAKGGFWLSLPASHLEKLITVIFFTTIIFFLVYNACFWILKPIAESFIHARIANEPGNYSYRTTFWGKGYDGFGIVFQSFLFGFFAVQALYLMASSFFSKHAFIKMTILGAAVIFLFIFYTIKLSEWAVPKGVYTGNFMEPSKTTIDILLWILRLIWAPIFWTITLFRLKEKQL